ncbi:MAG TPA: L,D-transpeptidase family protein [Acidimicrobiia bacterium]
MHVRGVTALAFGALVAASVVEVAVNGGAQSSRRAAAPHAAPHVVIAGPHAATTPSNSAPRTTITTSAATSTTPPPHATTPSTQAHAVITTAPATAAPPLLVNRLSGIGGAGQVIAVATDGYGSSIATITAYQRGANGWTQVFGPWSSYIGRDGVAPVGAKREGDGRTPSGVFGFDFMFGVDANPGVRYEYRHTTGSNFVWDDDSSSPNYNEWVDDTTTSAGTDPEPMDATPSYLYGAVIGYNDARTPGLGSGIFLHVTHGSPTSGCVSLPEGDLLDVLRWLDPSQSPRIAIGTLSSLTSQ